MGANITNNNKTVNKTVNSTVSNITTNSSIYVDCSIGDDTNNGSVNCPKKTIKAGLSSVASNGTIYLSKGTFNENNLVINKSINIIGQSRSDTIINGNGNNSLSILDNSTVKIQTITFTNAKGDHGGAINNKGILSVVDCSYVDNSASYGGGAIYSENILNVENSDFTNNKATDISTGYGGAIFTMHCTCKISDSKFYNNDAKVGGAVNNNNFNGSLAIVNSEFVNNNATLAGAVFTYENSVINSSTFKKNKASKAGSIYNVNNLKISQTTFDSNNVLFDEGGAIINIGTINIDNSKFNKNHAINGGIISNFGICNLTTCQIKDNSVDIEGGSIINHENATLTVTKCNFNNNTGINAGSISSSGTINIQENNFTDNHAQTGGTIANLGAGSINYNNFNKNNATNGGAIYNNAMDRKGLQINYNNFTENIATRYGAALYNQGFETLSYNNFTRNQITSEEGLGGALLNINGTVYINNGNEFFHNIVVSGSSLGDPVGGGIANLDSGHLYVSGSSTKFTDTYIYNDGYLDLGSCLIEMNGDGKELVNNNPKSFIDNGYSTNYSNHNSFLENTDPNADGATHIDTSPSITVIRGKLFHTKAELWGKVNKWWLPTHDEALCDKSLCYTIYDKDRVYYTGYENTLDVIDKMGNAYLDIPTAKLAPGHYYLKIAFRDNTDDYTACYKTVDLIVERPVYGDKETHSNNIQVNNGDTFAIIRPATETLDLHTALTHGIRYLDSYEYVFNQMCYIFKADVDTNQLGQHLPVNFKGKDPSQPISWYSTVYVQVGELNIVQ
jgi:hypothetical protein